MLSKEINNLLLCNDYSNIKKFLNEFYFKHNIKNIDYDFEIEFINDLKVQTDNLKILYFILDIYIYYNLNILDFKKDIQNICTLR